MKNYTVDEIVFLFLPFSLIAFLAVLMITQTWVMLVK